jgi:putative transposase
MPARSKQSATPRPTPSRHTAPKYAFNSANRCLAGPNPYRFNSATNATRIWPGTVQAIRAALYKRGVPEQLLVDNGSIYSSQEIILICARVGCILRHTAVRDAAAKGKIERFFRRVRDQFLVKTLDLSSLENLNRQFTHWVENDYNAVPHDAIGMKPIDRFGIDLARLRFLPPSEHNDELFYAEADRKVKKDNTFSFAGRRYESPVDLRDKKIQLRFDRRRLDTTAVIIYHNGQRMAAARLLDAVANGLLRRKEQS